MTGGKPLHIWRRRQDILQRICSQKSLCRLTVILGVAWRILVEQLEVVGIGGILELRETITDSASSLYWC